MDISSWKESRKLLRQLKANHRELTSQVENLTKNINKTN